MGEKNIWERIKDSSNCRALILNSDSYSLPESSFGIYREKISK